MYLIPGRVLAGRVMVLLRNYRKYIAGDIGSLMKFSAPAAGDGLAGVHGLIGLAGPLVWKP
jgi:hypothetical protein